MAGKPSQKHRGDEGHRVCLRHVSPVAGCVLWPVLADNPRDRPIVLSAHRAAGEKAPERPLDTVEYCLPRIHRLEDVGRYVGMKPRRHVCRGEDGVEPHRVEIKHVGYMPAVPQAPGELVEHRVAERLRIRVRIDRQDSHTVSNETSPVRPLHRCERVPRAWASTVLPARRRARLRLPGSGRKRPPGLGRAAVSLTAAQRRGRVPRLR